MNELDIHITQEIRDIIRRTGNGTTYTPSTWVHIHTTKYPIWIIAENEFIHIEIGGLIQRNIRIELNDANAFDKMVELIKQYEK